MIFDTHAHYDDKRFKNDYEEIIKNFKEDGISKMCNIGIDLETSNFSVELSKKFDNVYSTVGVHPHNVKGMSEKTIVELKKIVCKKEGKIVAIGEIGLDYHYDFSPKEEQIKWFKKQIELAKQLKLPIVVHAREADQAVYDIIKESGINKGVLHCFSGSKELGDEYIKLGFKLGIGGVITFKNAKNIKRVVEEIDIKHLVIETDAPYLTPIPFRGERNESKYLKYVCEKIGEIKNISPEEVAKKTYENSLKVFNI